MNNVQNNIQAVGEQLKSIPQAIGAQVTNAQASISNTMDSFASTDCILF